MKELALIIGVCGVLAISGCGAGSAGSANFDSSKTVAAKKPEPPPLPQGPTSDELVVEDLIEGDGAEVGEGDAVSVYYRAGIYETGDEVESTWVNEEPLRWRIGSNYVRDGWEEGIPGMRVGGRRMLLIPTPEDIAPPKKGSTLVYIIDMLELRDDVP